MEVIKKAFDDRREENRATWRMEGGTNTRYVKISDRFKVCKKLGAGSFGELYSGINMKTHEEVAIKIEDYNKKNPMLTYEH